MTAPASQAPSRPTPAVPRLDTVEAAAATPDEVQPYGELGLKEDEYQRIKDILGRRPTAAELAMYSVMWSEHCSYKSSKVHLSKFGEKVTDEMKEHLLVGIGRPTAQNLADALVLVVLETEFAVGLRLIGGGGCPLHSVLGRCTAVGELRRHGPSLVAAREWARAAADAPHQHVRHCGLGHTVGGVETRLWTTIRPRYRTRCRPGLPARPS